MDMSQTFPLVNNEGGQTARVRDEYRGLRAVAGVDVRRKRKKGGRTAARLLVVFSRLLVISDFTATQVLCLSHLMSFNEPRAIRPKRTSKKKSLMEI